MSLTSQAIVHFRIGLKKANPQKTIKFLFSAKRCLFHQTVFFKSSQILSRSKYRPCYKLRLQSKQILNSRSICFDNRLLKSAVRLTKGRNLISPNSKSTSLISSLGLALQDNHFCQNRLFHQTLPSNKDFNDLGLNFDKQTIKVSEDGARISILCPNKQLVRTHYDDVFTLLDAFQRGLRISGDGKCFGWRPTQNSEYKWMTYKEVDLRAKRFGAGLMKIGLKPGDKTMIGIYSINRPEYLIAEIGFMYHSVCTVPLYDTLIERPRAYILNDAKINVLICDSNTKVNKILNAIDQTPLLKTLIVFNKVRRELLELANNLGIKILQFTDVEKLGKENPCEPTLPGPHDVAVVCYTSGTTGSPKGVMLTHENFVCTSSSCNHFLEMNGYKQFCYISYLPLAHSFERLAIYGLFMTGSQIGFFFGDIKRIMSDIKVLQPTLFVTVPRLLNRIYHMTMGKIESNPIKKKIFMFALERKKKLLEKKIICNDTIWDKLVFKDLQKALGGRLELVFTGSAPMTPEALTMLRCALGCPIAEGYGQTENAAGATAALIGDFHAGHVGPPLTCNMVKLIDVPEMEYFSKDDAGEICIKGFNVFPGYFGDDTLTKTAIDKDGWLHTGDVGMWTETGTLKVIDRKKNILKLAQGRFVAPEKIEKVLTQSVYIEQIYIDVDSYASFLVAIIVPNRDTIETLCTRKLQASGKPFGECFEELVAHPVVKEAVLSEIKALHKRFDLNPLEEVKDVFIWSKQFTIEEGLLTPTLKNKRKALKKRFKKEIEEMYKREHDC